LSGKSFKLFLPAGGVYSALPDPLGPSWNKGDLLPRKGQGCREGKGRTGRRRQREGRGEERRGR